MTRRSAAVLGLLLFAGAPQAFGEMPAPIKRYPIETYSQKTLLKNWALSVCFAQIAKDDRTADDAGLTASAYVEFIRQGPEAYEQLRKLVDKYKSLPYAGSVKSDYSTMKCIDLFHSKELDRLVTKLVRQG